MQLSGMMGWSGRDPGSRLHYLEAGARLRSAVAGPGPDGGTSGARGTLRVALAPGASSHRARHGRRQAVIRLRQNPTKDPLHVSPSLPTFI